MDEVESDVLEDADELKEASDSEEELEDAPSELEALGLLQRVQASGALQGFDLKQARAIPIATGSALHSRAVSSMLAATSSLVRSPVRKTAAFRQSFCNRRNGYVCSPCPGGFAPGMPSVFCGSVSLVGVAGSLSRCSDSVKVGRQSHQRCNPAFGRWRHRQARTNLWRDGVL